MAAKRVVHTELEEKEYQLLLSAASSKRMTIKEAARTAILEWSMSSGDFREDSFVRLEPVRLRTRVGAKDIDGFLYQR